MAWPPVLPGAAGVFLGVENDEAFDWVEGGAFQVVGGGEAGLNGAAKSRF